MVVRLLPHHVGLHSSAALFLHDSWRILALLDCVRLDRVLDGGSVPRWVLRLLVPIVREYQVYWFLCLVNGRWVSCWLSQCLSVASIFDVRAVQRDGGIVLLFFSVGLSSEVLAVVFKISCLEPLYRAP